MMRMVIGFPPSTALVSVMALLWGDGYRFFFLTESDELAIQSCGP